jgi:tetratricopeptide (TPR) repeat protein
LDGENLGIVERICRELECIPLAVELAVPKLRVFSLAELSAKLAEHVHVLSLASHDGSERQQTIRALIQWSVETLTPAERLLFVRLGIFAGGWTIEAASSICSGNGIEAWDVLDTLIALVDKSLVFVESGRNGRYGMLVPLQEFARRQLEASPELGAIKQRHLDYYVGLVERADRDYWLAESAETFEDPATELDNARAALEWALEGGGDRKGGARLAATLARFWFFARDEGRRWAELAAAVLEPGEEPAIEARLDLGFAQLESFPSHATRDRAARAAEYYRSSGDELRTAEALYHLSMTMGLYYTSERELADAYASEGLELSRRLGSKRLLVLSLRAKAQVTETQAFDVRRDLLLEGLELAQQQLETDRIISMFLMSLSELEFEAGRYDEAIAYAKRAVRAAEGAKSARFLILTKTNLAHYACAAGDYATGRTEALQAVRLAEREEDEYSLTVALHCFAAVDAAIGNPRRAAVLMGFCDARFANAHAPRQEGSCEEAVYESVRDKLTAKIGSRALEAAAADGARLAKAEALRLVRSDEPSD